MNDMPFGIDFRDEIKGLTVIESERIKEAHIAPIHLKWYQLSHDTKVDFAFFFCWLIAVIGINALWWFIAIVIF